MRLGVILLLASLACALSPLHAAGDIRLKARIQLDSASYHNGRADVNDAVFVRAARFGLDGPLDEHWFLKAEFDVADGDVNWENLYLGYRLGRGTITLGERKVPLSMNRIAGMGDLTFAERALPVGSLTDSSRLGLYYGYFRPGLGVQTMAYTLSANDDESDRPLGVALRVIGGASADPARVLHLAAAVAYERYDDNDVVRFSDRPEARLEKGDIRLVDTGAIDGADGALTTGLEAALQRGPFTFQSEYLRLTSDRSAEPDPTFDGYYAEASYRLTGEHRAYDGQAFGGLRPEGPYGAWELVARYSHVDLNDAGISGGRQTNVTLGLNWYATEHVRFKLNAIRARVRDSDAEVRGRTVGNEDATILVLRAQVSL